MDNSSGTKTIAGHCYCKTIQYTVTLPVSELPIGVQLCHCSNCRYTHGTMCIFHANLPVGVKPQFDPPNAPETSITKYAFKNSLGDRWFCSKCGSHIGHCNPVEDRWYFATALVPKDESIFVIDSHIYTKSAPDGLWEWLPNIGNRKLDNWAGLGPGLEDGSENPKLIEPEFGEDGQERLRAKCHCGGVDFTIKRPTEEVLNDKYFKEFVSPVDKTKFKALIDCCNDCRLVSGIHINAWIFVPLQLLEPKIDLNFALGTMKKFMSSPGVTRVFCGRCGATVFYSADFRGTVVNVSTGLLRAPEGVRAENWLTWRTNQVGMLSYGVKYDKEFYESLNEGFRNWGIKKYGQVYDFTVPDEEPEKTVLAHS